MTFHLTDLWRPFAGAGQWCDEAGLPHCCAHGLHKAVAVTAAQNGAMPRQMMSVFGWLPLKQVKFHTRAAQQRLMAVGAMKLLMRDKDEMWTFRTYPQSVSRLGLNI